MSSNVITVMESQFLLGLDGSYTGRVRKEYAFSGFGTPSCQVG